MRKETEENRKQLNINWEQELNVRDYEINVQWKYIIQKGERAVEEYILIKNTRERNNFRSKFPLKAKIKTLTREKHRACERLSYMHYTYVNTHSVALQ